MADGPTTRDTLFAGAVVLEQPAHGRGYRTNVDALLLAAFAASRRARPARLALDLGSGVGAVALALDHLGAARSFALVDVQAPLIALATRNVAANGLGERATCHHGDLARGLLSIAPELARAADLVVANPPYVSPARDGRPDRRDARVAPSRHGELEPFLLAAAAGLATRGRACFVYPSHALLELASVAARSGLVPKRMRLVHGRAGKPARVALVELVRGHPGGLEIEPPLVESDEGGAALPEIASLLRAPRREQAIERDRARRTDAQMVVPRARRPLDRG